MMRLYIVALTSLRMRFYLRLPARLRRADDNKAARGNELMLLITITRV